MINKDAKKRLTIQQALIHPWVTQIGDQVISDDSRDAVSDDSADDKKRANKKKQPETTAQWEELFKAVLIILRTQPVKSSIVIHHFIFYHQNPQQSLISTDTKDTDVRGDLCLLNLHAGAHAQALMQSKISNSQQN